MNLDFDEIDYAEKFTGKKVYDYSVPYFGLKP